jgi:nucleotide-binding universal stress UspA family protein
MKVLFAIDFSSHSKNAVQLFRRMQLPAGSEVHLIHVNNPEEWPESGESGPSPKQSEPIAGIRERAGLHAKEALSQLGKVFQGQSVNLHTQVVNGNPGREILKILEQGQMNLVVLGSRGLSKLAGLLLGSVSEWVLNEAPCSVLVGRPRARQKGGPAPMRIVLAVDGSPDAWAAVDFLKQFQFSPSSKLTLVYVVRKHIYQTEQVLVGDPSEGEAFARLAEEVLDKRGREGVALLEKTREHLAKLNLTVVERLVFGHEGQEILKAAKQTHADLVVVGSRGITRLRRFLLGSVSHKVATNAPCSVLVIRSKGE